MTTPGRRTPAAAIVALVAVLALVAGTGCRGDAEPDPGPTVTRPPATGDPRSTLLGFGAIPAGTTSEEYIRAFALAATYADVILIQRAPPWSEFLPGGRVSTETEDLTRLETALIDQYGLRVLFVIDPTDSTVERARLAGLPAGVDGSRGLGNASLREALAGYAAYVATNYRPDYLAIGAEIDMYAERRPEQFDAFVEAYAGAYDVAKAASPSSLIFPTFQFEELQGNVGQAHPPKWDLLDRFEARIDALAVTTFPFLTPINSARNIPEHYYAELAGRFPGPVIIAGAGYSSLPVRGSTVPGTEEDQATFLEHLQAESEPAGFELVVWLAPVDPPVTATGAGASFRGIGLRRTDGSEKIAWALWEEWSRRPLDPPPR